jgi:hypothetical protein
MKTLQGMLAQYFIMKSEFTMILFVSSSNKLKLFQKKNQENQETASEETSSLTKKKENMYYKDHKKDAIRHTLEIIEKNQIPWLYHIETSKKKDDLADSFLQGISYLHRMGIIDIHQYLLSFPE